MRWIVQTSVSHILYAVDRDGVLPAIGFALTIWLWTSLQPTTWLVGAVWIVLGVAVIAVVTGGFKRPVPRMNFSEAEPTTEQVDLLADEYPLEGEKR